MLVLLLVVVEVLEVLVPKIFTGGTGVPQVILKVCHMVLYHLVAEGITGGGCGSSGGNGE